MLKLLSRFFLPVKHNVQTSIQLLVESSLATLWFDILPLYTIPFMINLIETKNFDQFFKFSYIIFAVYFVFWLLGVYLRKWDFQAKYVFTVWVEETFRKKLILKDNLAMDVLGTGKVQSLVQKGMSDWVEAVWQILYQLPKVFLTVMTGVLIMKGLGCLLGLLLTVKFCFLLLLLLSLLLYLQL
jgi:hypothetical protein